MVYISHLLKDEDMVQLTQKYDCGVESIEFSVADNLDNLPQNIYSYRRRLEKMGCEKLTIHGPFLDLNPMSYDSLALENTFIRYEQAYQAAKALGAKKIVYHTCYIPRVYLLIKWADRVADFYKKFLENKEGIEILMENVQDPEIAPILQVAKKVDHPDFGLCLDIGHANCYSKSSVMKWTTNLAPYVKHVHVHDNDGTADKHLGIGMGNIPVKEVLEHITRENPKVTMTIECSQAQHVEDSIKWLKQNGFM